MTTDQPEPILTERCTDVHGTYTREWYCQPPAKGAAFHVIRSTWTPDHIIRRIYEIRIGDVW